MTQAGAARTTRPQKRKAARVFILRNIPKGFSWGWYSREDPRMHLQTVDSKNLNRYKVWLEKNGKRVFEPAGRIPGKVLSALEEEVTKLRSHVEGRWTNFMIENDWLIHTMRGSVITLTAYPGFPGGRFTRSFDLADYLQGIYNPVSQMWPKIPVKPDEVVLNDEMAAVEIWPQRHESRRYHIFLPDILWED